LRGALATKQSTLLSASRSLSSGAHSRDPVARNDVDRARACAIPWLNGTCGLRSIPIYFVSSA
jgi:hypothetical protein